MKMGKGITLSGEELIKLREILNGIDYNCNLMKNERETRLFQMGKEV